MLAKIWKKTLMLVLIIACLFNVVTKLVHKSSIKDELITSARYVYNLNNKK